MADPFTIATGTAGLIQVPSLVYSGIATALDTPRHRQYAQEDLDNAQALVDYVEQMGLHHTDPNANRVLSQHLNAVTKSMEWLRNRLGTKIHAIKVPQWIRTIFGVRKVREGRARLSQTRRDLEQTFLLMSVTQRQFANHQTQLEMAGMFGPGQPAVFLLFGQANGASIALCSQIHALIEFLINIEDQHAGANADMGWRVFLSDIFGILHHLGPTGGLKPLIVQQSTLSYSSGPGGPHRRGIQRLPHESPRSPIPSLSTGRISGSPSILARVAFSATSSARLQTPEGTISIAGTAFYSYHLGKRTHIATANHLCFVPSLGSDKSGVVLRICRPASPDVSPPPPTVSTFRVRPSNTGVFHAVKNRESTEVVRGFFSDASDPVSPNDRDEQGCTMLSHAIANGDIETCKLLLDYGADQSDCNRFGDSSEALVLEPPVIGPNHNSTPKRMPGAKTTPLLRLFNQYTNTLYYRSPSSGVGGNGGSFRPRGHVAGSNFFPPIMADQVDPTRDGGPPVMTSALNSYVKLAQAGGGLESMDCNGHTSLFFAIARTTMPLSLDIAIWLLEMRANHKVVNPRGEGLLHILLRRLGACSSRVLHHRSLKVTAFHLLTMLLLKQDGQGQQRRPCGCSSDAPHLLNALLQRSEAGLTAFDAAMSPAVWPVLCSAVDKAGYSMGAHLREVDKRAGVSTPSHDQIERQCDLVFKSGSFTSPPPQPIFLPHVSSSRASHYSNSSNMDMPPPPAQARVCYICGAGSETHPRSSPFNLYLPCLVNEQGLDIHDMHRNPDVTVESRSEQEMEMSWRRWVALRLWERGYFA